MFSIRQIGPAHKTLLMAMLGASLVGGLQAHGNDGGVCSCGMTFEYVNQNLRNCQAVWNLSRCQPFIIVTAHCACLGNCNTQDHFPSGNVVWTMETARGLRLTPLDTPFNSFSVSAKIEIDFSEGSVDCGAFLITATDSGYPPNPPVVKSGTLIIEPGLGCEPPNGCPPDHLGCISTRGDVSTDVDSVRMHVALGRCSFGKTAGVLSIHQDTPTNILSKPIALNYKYRNEVTACEVLTNANGIFQVKADECLAQIVTNSASGYLIQIYDISNVLAKVDGYYQLTNSPMRTIVVTNPEPGSVNKLNVADGDGNTSYFEWNTTGWELRKGAGVYKRYKEAVWSAGDTIRTSKSETKDGDNNVITAEQRKYQKFDYGVLKVEEIRGTGAAALTDTFSYYAAGYPTGLLYQVLQTNGYWETHQYHTNRMETNRCVALLNQAPTTNASLCRSFSYSYGSNAVPGAADTGELDPATPRCTIEFVQGKEVARSYVLRYFCERRDIQCLHPGAAWNTPSNLVTITCSYTNGVKEGRLKRIERPNGTIEIYDYVLGTNAGVRYETNIVMRGKPDAAKTNVLDGEMLITTLGFSGQLVNRIAIDIASGITVSSQVYSDYDGNFHPQKVTYLDGTEESTIFGCCGPLTQTTREGTTITNLFDSLNRRTATTRSGITVTNILDAAGNILKNVRIGSDGTRITNATHTYNTAGQRTSTTDALGNVTTNIEVILSNQLIRTNIFPDQTTRIETHYRDGRLEKLAGTSGHSARHVHGVAEDGTGNWRSFSAEIKLDDSGSDTPEVVTNFFDMLGRNYKNLYGDASSRQTVYNTNGQKVAEIDPDGVTMRFVYNSRGQVEFSYVDMNGDGTTNFAGTDRITQTTSVVTNKGITNVRQTRSDVWPILNSDTSLLTSLAQASTDGLLSWHIAFGVTNYTRTVYAGSGNRYVTNIAGDASLTVSHFLDGKIQSTTRMDGATQLSKTTYAYDSHGRQSAVIDARNGVTTYAYDSGDRRSSVTTPVSGTGYGRQTTSYSFDSAGRVTRTTYADGTSMTNEYHPTGTLKKVAGSRTYPVEYNYDPQGRMTNMVTWQNYPSSGSAITTWKYDAKRGWLTNKLHAGDATGSGYAYTPAGRLRLRTWQRGISTTNNYNAAGDLVSIHYLDGSTSNVTYNLDRLGRRTNIVDGIGTRYLTYNDAGQLLSETNAVGQMAGTRVTCSYDSLSRRTAVKFYTNNATEVFSRLYAFDGASRLTNVSGGTYGAAYSYLANSPLLSAVTYRSNNVLRMTRTNQYDFLNRLVAVQSATNSSAASAISFSYSYNDANQRTRVTCADNTYWLYEYDELGQLINGKHYWADGTPVAGQQFEYNFDDIGNRTSTKAGGDETGLGLRSASYNVNALNQYTSRDVPGAADVMGIARADATVTVNGQSTYRKGEYYWKELSLANGSAPVYASVTNLAWSGSTTNTNTGNIFLPKTAELFSYDSDGNQTGNGRWTNRWDGENRLIEMESIASVPDAAKKKLVFKYDDRGRRVSKTVSNWTGSAWALAYERKFAYDSWNLIAEVDGNNNVVRSYVWGLDLSGSEQGAGGVGGLLAINEATNGVHFVAYDGNGNVCGLATASDGNLSARYEYDPFGRTIRASGIMAAANPVRFSSKYSDAESGWRYYTHRYYDADTGRWLNRDPIAEVGFDSMSRTSRISLKFEAMNLYAFVQNDPINSVDALGLETAGMRCTHLATLMSIPSFCYYCAFVITSVPESPRNAVAFQLCQAKAHSRWDIACRHKATRSLDGACADLLDCYNKYW